LPPNVHNLAGLHISYRKGVHGVPVVIIDEVTVPVPRKSEAEALAMIVTVEISTSTVGCEKNGLGCHGFVFSVKQKLFDSGLNDASSLLASVGGFLVIEECQKTE
jgi:hypothetical protein